MFWFLENYPYTYEADLYFNKFYGYDIVLNKDINPEGGKVMERDHSSTVTKGHFKSIGGDI